MGFKVVFSAQAERDLELVFAFLLHAYIDFGDDPGVAIDRAEIRLQEIRGNIETLAKAPHRGTLHNDILPGMRHVSFGQAIVWFDIDEASRHVRVLAVFFGGQDHVRHMLIRLLSQ